MYAALAYLTFWGLACCNFICTHSLIFSPPPPPSPVRCWLHRLQIFQDTSLLEMPLHVSHPPIFVSNLMLSSCSQKGKLEMQQLLLLLKPEPEWLSLVAGGLQSCSHLVAKFQITVHKPLHIPTNEHVRVRQCFIHNGLLRLGNQYQIAVRGGGVDHRLQGRI